MYTAITVFENKNTVNKNEIKTKIKIIFNDTTNARVQIQRNQIEEKDYLTNG